MNERRPKFRGCLWWCIKCNSDAELSSLSVKLLLILHVNDGHNCKASATCNCRRRALSTHRNENTFNDEQQVDKLISLVTDATVASAKAVIRHNFNTLASCHRFTKGCWFWRHLEFGLLNRSNFIERRFQTVLHGTAWFPLTTACRNCSPNTLRTAVTMHHCSCNSQLPQSYIAVL